MPRSVAVDPRIRRATVRPMPDPATVATQIAAIKGQFPDGHSSPGAFAEASALWNGGQNEHGVFTNGRYEEAARFGKCCVSLTIAESETGSSPPAAGSPRQRQASGTRRASGIRRSPRGPRQGGQRAPSCWKGSMRWARCRGRQPRRRSSTSRPSCGGSCSQGSGSFSSRSCPRSRRISID